MYSIEFTAEELIILEMVLKKTIQSNSTTDDKIIINFTREEMENMEQILLNELHINLDIWLDLYQKQENRYDFIEKLPKKNIKPTIEMKQQWKYTGKIENIYDRIAAPIGKSKRKKL